MVKATGKRLSFEVSSGYQGSHVDISAHQHSWGGWF